MVTTRLDKAFRACPRRQFLPEVVRDMAELDGPLPIGYGQTNSQPSTVRQMLEWLNVKPGAKVLDVGSGSGWTTALLSYLVGERGKVIAVEIIPELVKMGRRNCRRTGVTNATFHRAGPIVGWPREAPYDAILVSASADSLSATLVDQLNAPGRLVIPVDYDVCVITKSANGTSKTQKFHDYEFVPLIDVSV